MNGVDGEDAEDEDEEMDGTDGIGERSRSQSISQRNVRKNSQTDGVLDTPYSSAPSVLVQGFPAPPYYVNKAEGTRGHVSMETFLAQEGQLDQHPVGTAGHAAEPIPLTHEEALLVHHYTEHIGRWLDCTDATDQFTLGVPVKITLCSVLRHAVIALAARHSRKDSVAEVAYQRCISLLILRLNEEAASHDETLLCAIVILHFYEQLSGKLARCSRYMQSLC